jgi:transposase
MAGGNRVLGDQMLAFFANLPACVIGMEACGSAHYCARKLQRMGHTVRLIAPQFVKPYVKTNKTTRPTPKPFARRLRALGFARDPLGSTGVARSL